MKSMHLLESFVFDFAPVDVMLHYVIVDVVYKFVYCSIILGIVSHMM